MKHIRHLTGVMYVYDTDAPNSKDSRDYMETAAKHLWDENAAQCNTNPRNLELEREIKEKQVRLEL